MRSMQLVECEHLWMCHDLPGVESRSADGVVLAPFDFNQFQGRAAALHVDPLESKIRLASKSYLPSICLREIVLDG